MNQHEIDLKSLEQAKEFYTAGKDAAIIPGAMHGLIQIHEALFGGLYAHAGKIRQVNLSKGGFRFAGAIYLDDTLKTIEKMPDSTFDEIIEKYVELNIAHPFMEGNGRAGRVWLDILLRFRLGKVVDWSKIGKFAYLSAMERSPVNDLEIKHILRNALTDKHDDREVIFKGLEQSYYYEGLSLPEATKKENGR